MTDNSNYFLTFIYLFVCLFVWLCQVSVAARSIFVAACGIFVVACGIFRCGMRDLLVAACGNFSCSMQTHSCSMWDLVPWPRIKPRPPALGEQSLSHWTTREILTTVIFKIKISSIFLKRTSNILLNLQTIIPNLYKLFQRTEKKANNLIS